MTDNEIIKALPKILYGGHGCIKCEYAVKKGNDRCGLKGCRIAQDALALINRQKAEIERLKKIQQRQADLIVEERGRRYELANTLSKEIKTAKSEAIREFAEKHKEMMREFTDDGNDFIMKWCEYETNTNNLEKEMVGEDNA